MTFAVHRIADFWYPQLLHVERSNANETTDLGTAK